MNSRNPASYYRATIETRGGGTSPETFACVQALRSAAELLNEAASMLVGPGSDGVPVDLSGLPVFRFRTANEAVTASLDLIDKAKAHGGHLTFPPPSGKVTKL